MQSPTEVQPRRSAVKALVSLSFLTVLCCVSRTTPEQRVEQSKAAVAPTLQVQPADPARFTFAAVGDLHILGGNTTRFQAILAAAKAEGDAFIVLLGDIVDKGAASDVAAFRLALTQGGWDGKAFPVIGNHDVFNDGWTSYLASNGPSFYSFTAGNAKFVVIDTADGTLAESQSDWLEKELVAPANGPLFLLSHYLPVIPDQRTYLKLASETESAKLMHLATARGVTAWMGAHYHSYIRKQIDGVEYVVAGGGGGRRMEPVADYFFVQVVVDGSSVDFVLRPVP